MASILKDDGIYCFYSFSANEQEDSKFHEKVYGFV